MRVVEVPPTAQNLQRIATATIETFQDHRIELFDHTDLRRDLNRLMVEERGNNSFRLVSPQTADGAHGDIASALGMALLAASDLADRRKVKLHDASRPIMPQGSTRTDQALAMLAYHQGQCDLEQMELERKHRQEGHNAPIREAMRRFGRL